jgi:hypothetical protein
MDLPLEIPARQVRHRGRTEANLLEHEFTGHTFSIATANPRQIKAESQHLPGPVGEERYLVAVFCLVDGNPKVANRCKM